MRYIFCTHSEKALPLYRNSTNWVAQNVINQLKITRMKKLLIFALCLLGLCNARAEMMTAQEIILTEVYCMQPWDSKDDDKIIEPTDRTSFYASIDKMELYVSTGEDASAYVEIVDEETGNVVAEEEFVGETTIYIPQSGDYELYIYTESGIVLTGEFSVM